MNKKELKFVAGAKTKNTESNFMVASKNKTYLDHHIDFPILLPHFDKSWNLTDLHTKPPVSNFMSIR